MNLLAQLQKRHKEIHVIDLVLGAKAGPREGSTLGGGSAMSFLLFRDVGSELQNQRRIISEEIKL